MNLTVRLPGLTHYHRDTCNPPLTLHKPRTHQPLQTGNLLRHRRRHITKHVSSTTKRALTRHSRKRR